MSQPLTFKSRIDTWVLVVMLGLVSIAVLGIDSLLATESIYGWIGAAVVVVLGILLPLWILVYTGYELGDEQLRIHCGPFRWTVGLDEIASVSPILSAGKSPALSSSRLQLELGNGRSIMISPDNRDIFLRSLESRRAELGAQAAAKP